jgi:PilZ domain
VFWSIYDIAILLLAATVCIELPQRRRYERFRASERAVLRGKGNAESVCTIADLSLGGAKIAGALPPWANEQDEGILVLDRAPWKCPFALSGGETTCNPLSHSVSFFDAATLLRRALTSRLFTGSYRSTVEQISVPRVLLAIVKRLLR